MGPRVRVRMGRGRRFFQTGVLVNSFGPNYGVQLDEGGVIIWVDPEQVELIPPSKRRRWRV